MKRAVLRALVLALPLLGLGGTWGHTRFMAQQGIEWEVPIQGYDPRDLLRGHYITYRYAWPGLGQDRPDDNNSSILWIDRLCIAGTAPTIVRTWQPRPQEKCENLAIADEYAQADSYWLDRGKLYIPQAHAQAMQDKLLDSKLQGVIRIRLRKDGHITPLSITFRPRAVEQSQNR